MEYIVKGVFIDTLNKDNFRVFKGEILVCDGIIKQIGSNLNTKKNYKVYDYSDKIIIPGISDLHLHASQYSYCGTAMDLELIDWLNIYTFPEEAKFENLDFAKENYSHFVNDLKYSATTRACIFATIHSKATIELMNQLEQNKIIAYVGKLSMDRNSPEYYIEKNGPIDTKNFIKECINNKYEFVKPIITPRFTPSVTDNYMKKLGEIANEYDLHIQSHLSENLDEIKWVKELRKDDNCYAESYLKANLFNNKTVMAHCIYSDNYENKLVKDNGVFIAHCPTSNVNVIAGICPAGYYLRNGYNIGLGSDVAGGNTLNMFEVMKVAIQSSKNRYRLIDNNIKPLKLSEVFYMATTLGGSFFGNVGLFNIGYEFDALVLDDSFLNEFKQFDYIQRLERFIYLQNGSIISKYIKGNKIF